MSQYLYAGYASNMARERFMCYLKGGAPPGAFKGKPGARDSSPPRCSVACWLPGTAYFATLSRTWGGGAALYDPLTPGRTAARAWLVTAGQLSDIALQEAGFDPGEDLELPCEPGGLVTVNDTRYGVLACTQVISGYPVVTLAAPWRAGDTPPLLPSLAYRDVITQGLRETFGWPASRCREYIAQMHRAGGLTQANPPCTV